MTAVNLNETTRTMWSSTLYDQVIEALPVVAMFKEYQRFDTSGSAIEGTCVIADFNTSTSLAQEYAETEQMTDAQKTVAEKFKFYYKNIQVPVLYPRSVARANEKGGTLVAPIKTVRMLVEAGQAGMRSALNTILYRAGSATRDAEQTGSTTGMQGLLDALTHDLTYGLLARATTGTRMWWQGASLADSYADIATAVTPSIANVRKMAAICRRHRSPKEKLYLIVGEQNHQALKAQVQASITYPQTGTQNLMKYGFDSFMIDNVECVCDSWLSSNSGKATTYTYAFMLNPQTWEFRTSPDRNFTLTPFEWQGQNAGGYDNYLARILLEGNIICTQPNANMAKTAMA